MNKVDLRRLQKMDSSPSSNLFIIAQFQLVKNSIFQMWNDDFSTWWFPVQLKKNYYPYWKSSATNLSKTKKNK